MTATANTTLLAQAKKANTTKKSYHMLILLRTALKAITVNSPFAGVLP